MKKFDLHKIMGNAHKLHKNARAKYNTFSEALKKAWAMAKFEVRIAAVQHRTSTLRTTEVTWGQNIAQTKSGLSTTKTIKL